MAIGTPPARFVRLRSRHLTLLFLQGFPRNLCSCENRVRRRSSRSWPRYADRPLVVSPRNTQTARTLDENKSIGTGCHCRSRVDLRGCRKSDRLALSSVWFLRTSPRRTGGIIGHAQLAVAEGAIMLGRQGGPFSSPQAHPVTQYVHITVPDVNRHFEQAKQCGARIVQELPFLTEG